MVCLIARHGRLLQRYNKEGGRLVVGCIPYRKKSLSNDSTIIIDIDQDLEVLVITSQKSEALMFPKGGWEIDESLKEAAKREAVEEAGVVGELEDMLGIWSYKSKRYGTMYEGRMFPMKVTSELTYFAQMQTRKKKWVSIAEAKRGCRDLWMREALELLVQRVSHTNKSRLSVIVLLYLSTDFVEY